MTELKVAFLTDFIRSFVRELGQTIDKMSQSVSPSPFAISIGGEILSKRLLMTGYHFFVARAISTQPNGLTDFQDKNKNLSGN